MLQVQRRRSNRWLWVLTVSAVSWAGTGRITDRLVSPASGPAPNAIASLGAAASVLLFVLAVILARRARLSGRAWAIGLIGAAIGGSTLVVGALLNHKSLSIAVAGGLVDALLAGTFMGGGLYWYQHVGGQEYLAAQKAAGASSRRARATLLLGLWYVGLFGDGVWLDAPWRRESEGLGAWIHAAFFATVFSTAVMIVTLAMIGAAVRIGRRIARVR